MKSMLTKTVSWAAIFLLIPCILNGKGISFQADPSNEPVVSSPESWITTNDETAISKFAISFNPLGFVQFGPVINAEIGLKDNLVLNGHVRLMTLGVMSYVVRYHKDGLDELSGMGFGGGLIYFPGEKLSKPYLGMLLEYEKSAILYAKDASWEWEETGKAVVFMFNGGYRFRFDGGLFINTGLLLGAATTQWEWDYTDPSYGATDNSSRSGTDINPFGMLEITIGIGF